MGNLDLKQVFGLALPPVFTAQIGALFASYIAPEIFSIKSLSKPTFSLSAFRCLTLD